MPALPLLKLLETPTPKVGEIELGMAGQLRVASELIMRGHRPALSLIDKWVDLITEKGLTVQVKTSRLGEKSRRYVFNFANWHKTAHHKMEGVDFIVCWGVTTNEFWIFPVSAIKQRMMRVVPTSLGQGRQFDHRPYKDAWHLLD